MKKALTLLTLLVALPLASPAQVIIDFGSDPGKADFADAAFNYGGTSRVSNADSISYDLATFAQSLWYADLSIPPSPFTGPDAFGTGVTGIDLSGFDSGALQLQINGDITIPGGESARLIFYTSTLSGGKPGMTAFSFSTGFTGSFTIADTSGFNNFSTDGFGNSFSGGSGTTSGTFDWSNVTSISLRSNSAGTVSLDIDSLALIPEPSTAMALTLGLTGLLGIRRLRK